MFKELCVVIDCQIESEFIATLKSFLEKYSRLNVKTKTFVDYFNQYCMKKKMKWAKCYRRFPHGDVDTTMFVESFHNILKTIYLKRKPNKRIETLLFLILEVEEDYYARRDITILSVAPREKFIQDICQRHVRGMQIPTSDLLEHNEIFMTCWVVKSQSHGDQFYKVFKNSESCTQLDMCYFHCHADDCHQNLCAHMYTCTCPDDFVLCKHIHAVHAKFGENSSTTIGESSSCDVEFHYNYDDQAINAEVSSELQEKKKNEKREREENELHEMISELDEATKCDAVKNVLYPHIKSNLKELLAQCRSVMHSTNESVPQMNPTVQRSSREKLQKQLPSFGKLKESKKKQKKKLSRIPKLQERINIKKNLLSNQVANDNGDSNSSYLGYSQMGNVRRFNAEPDVDNGDFHLDPNVHSCEEVSTSLFSEQGRTTVKPKIQFVARPIFTHGKSSVNMVDKHNPVV